MSNDLRRRLAAANPEPLDTAYDDAATAAILTRALGSRAGAATGVDSSQAASAATPRAAGASVLAWPVPSSQSPRPSVAKDERGRRSAVALAASVAALGVVTAGAIYVHETPREVHPAAPGTSHPHTTATATATATATGSVQPGPSGYPTAMPSPDAAHQPTGNPAGYPRNAKGQTYGPMTIGIPYGQTPDLIAARASNGQAGYVLRTDLEAPTATGTPRSIPVYTADGTTRIGEYLSAGTRLTTWSATAAHPARVPAALVDGVLQGAGEGCIGFASPAVGGLVPVIFPTGYTMDIGADGKPAVVNDKGIVVAALGQQVQLSGGQVGQDTYSPNDLTNSGCLHPGESPFMVKSIKAKAP